MSYNEEGLIRVKRGNCGSKKCQDDEEERIELQQQPTPQPVQIDEEERIESQQQPNLQPRHRVFADLESLIEAAQSNNESSIVCPLQPTPHPAQVLEGRPSNIILEETPLSFPCSTTGFENLKEELAREGQSDLLSKIEYLILAPIPCRERGLDVFPTSTLQIERSVENIIERSYYVLRAIKNNNWNEYEVEAHKLSNLYENLNHYLEQVQREYNEHLDTFFRTNEYFKLDQENDKILEMAKKYQKPAGRQNEQKLEFVLLTHEAIRSLVVGHVIEEFINNIMPHARIGLNTNGVNDDIVDLIRGTMLRGALSGSHSEIGLSPSLLVYQQHMESIYNNLSRELESTDYIRDFRTIRAGNFFYGYDHAPTDPVIGSSRILDNLRTLIRQQSERLEGAIAQSREESDALCAQLEEHDEQLIDAEGLRTEINTILSEYRENTLNPIEAKFGSSSSQYREAIRERSVLQQIIRDLISKDEVRIQQAISSAEQNKTIQQMLANKKLILITPTCKPFKDSHDKKDDDGDSDDAGNGGNNPGPSGKARSIESAEARSIVDIPEASSGFVKAVDDLASLIEEIKTSITETAEAERVYLVSNGDCRESKEISLKGFWKWAKGSCKHSHKDHENYDLLVTQRNEKMEKFLESIEYAVNFIGYLEKEGPSSEVGVSSRKFKMLQEAKKLFEVMNYAKDTNGRGEAIYAYQADSISKNYTKGKIEKLEDLLNKMDSVIDQEIDSYAHLHNSIIQKISHAATDIVTNTKKYHIAEADAAMKAGSLEDARKHAESAKESARYEFSPKGVQSYNEGDWENITLESLQQYAREKLDIAKASSEELKFFMRVYEKIIDKYTQTLREEDVSCKDCVLKIVTKSKLTDIKDDLDAALEELNGIETEKSNAQEVRDLLTETLEEEHALVSRVSDYSFGKILPTLDTYSVIFGTEKNLLDSVNLSKLPSLSKHFSINPEQLRADIDKTFADMTKVAGIDTQVKALKCGCIAMNNALTGDDQNAAQYLGETLKSRADRCVSGADKFLSGGFEPLLKDMHGKNFYRDKAPDFLSFNKLMCSIRNDNLHNEPHISAPQTVSLPDVAPIPAPDEFPPYVHDGL